MAPTSDPPSGASTPRFISQAATAEDLLKSQTVGLVNLAEFRKRRADVLDQKEREAQDNGRSGANTPGLESGDGALTPNSDAPPSKKKKKARKVLSYHDGEEEDDSRQPILKPSTGKSAQGKGPKKSIPNPNSSLPAPKAMTKAALAAEAEERERLRTEFLAMQERVKNSEVAIPFVFYDGANIPGDVVKVKKGDHIWLFLERARKVGAEKGVQGSGAAAGGMSSHDSKKQWARVGVDDLMCVRGGVIIPHHYEFYYFIANKVRDPMREGKFLFDYKGTADATEVEDAPLLRVPGQDKLEGRDDDPTYTKVVDRRWYEKNKHIFPASTWKEFKAGKEFEDAARQRKDVKLQKDHEARVAGSRKGICRACQHRPSPIWKVSQPTFTPHSLLLTRALECPESVRGVMDQPLRCNNQIGGYCRNQLTDEAVVTTCSHIFCLDCATKTRFTNAPLHERACPVCQTSLPNQDDAVQARLSPTEDYKTSVLSGLDPSTIMDCTSRALAFWTYQTTQEIFYQEHLGKNLKDKYGQLSTAMDNIIHRANTEISALQDKLSNHASDLTALQTKYDELAGLYREKSKKCAQTQQLYDALKKKFMLRGVETAASENVTQTIQSIANHGRPSTFQQQPAPDTLYSLGSDHRGNYNELVQPDLLGSDLRPIRHQRSSEVERAVQEMAAPLRPVANRNVNPAAIGTPVQRTTLPMQGRATVNRSQIPVSVKADTRHSSQNMGSSLRQGTFAEGHNRTGATTPRGFGMLGGMKVGRAGTSGGPTAEPRFSRPDGLY